MRTLYKKNNNENTLKKPTMRTLCKKNNNENTLSTIYEFNTSSEFRGFTYILNYFDANNTFASF